MAFVSLVLLNCRFTGRGQFCISIVRNFLKTFLRDEPFSPSAQKKIAAYTSCAAWRKKSHILSHWPVGIEECCFA